MADKPIEPPRRDESQIAEEAARWLEALKTAGETQQAQFAAWMRQSSRHVHYFLHTTALDGLLEQVDPLKRLNVLELVREANGNIVSLPSPNPMSRLPQRGAQLSVRWKSMAAGLFALGILALWLAMAHPWGWEEFTTRGGEQRAIELQDGSLVHLNVASRLRVRLTEKARELQLVEGEALFAVHHETLRPFKVHVDGKVIQALGTEFNVYRRAHSTKISVLQGAVRISADGEDRLIASAKPASLSAGEEAQIEPDGQVHAQHVPDISNAAAWRERRLVFRADSLSDVVTEFNRYNHAPKIRLEGLDGASRHYTGSFDAHDPGAFAAVLAEEKALSVERSRDEIVIRGRK
jgi:transmembrane sensor